MRKISLLLAVLSVGLSAKIWINAIRDPGAELGLSDWEVTMEHNSDSARVNAHDSSRAYEGKFSFLTDTKRYCGIVDGGVGVWCTQLLVVPKAVSDIDSCFWEFNMAQGHKDSIANFYICFHSKASKNIIWEVGTVSGTYPEGETTYSIQIPCPERSVWAEHGENLFQRWLDHNWLKTDTIYKIRLSSYGLATSTRWHGQEVSWDNIVLRSVAYYDYAVKSIDSDVPSGGKYTPIVTFANEGIKADKDAYVFAEILEGSTLVYVDSHKVTIPKESSKQVTFKEWSVAGGGPSPSGFTLYSTSMSFHPMTRLRSLWAASGRRGRSLSSL